MIRINGIQIAPCIVSKVLYALMFKSVPPMNKKHCSDQYWEKTVQYIGKLNNLDQNLIKYALSQTDLYRP